MVGTGPKEGKPSDQLCLLQGQAGQLGVVDEALPADNGIIDAATCEDTGSNRLLQTPLFSENSLTTHLRDLPLVPPSLPACPSPCPFCLGMTLPHLPNPSLRTLMCADLLAQTPTSQCFLKFLEDRIRDCLMDPELQTHGHMVVTATQHHQHNDHHRTRHLKTVRM